MGEQPWKSGRTKLAGTATAMGTAREVGMPSAALAKGIRGLASAIPAWE